jgi:hypothetical protein
MTFVKKTALRICYDYFHRLGIFNTKLIPRYTKFSHSKLLLYFSTIDILL